MFYLIIAKSKYILNKSFKACKKSYRTISASIHLLKKKLDFLINNSFIYFF